MAINKQKIGLLGGSFDPVHNAHIALADTAYRALSLDSVQLIPAGNPWQRAPLAASPQHRVAMLQLAVGDRPWLHINPIEIDRGGPTYTIDTLRALPAQHDYFWILGADQLRNFCTWRAWEDIADCVQLVVAERPGSPDTTPPALAQHLNERGKPLIHLPFSPRDISATDIRQRLARQLPVSPYLDPAVAAYIRQHQLYQSTL